MNKDETTNYCVYGSGVTDHPLSRDIRCHHSMMKLVKIMKTTKLT